MKPHIFLHCGLWTCRSGLTVGHGFTPAEAFKHWEERNFRYRDYWQLIGAAA